MATTPDGNQILDALAALTAAVTAGNQQQMDHRTDIAASQRAAAKSSSSSDKQHNKKQEGLLKSVVQNISLPLPGGARLFGISSFIDKIGQTSKQFESGQKSKERWDK